ncbi:MAG TPA: hypothetical protein VKB76_09400 [Ktedonobacterales bacterium]|nr:hypothetical protein [Ktedonobacterales bacterium]
MMFDLTRRALTGLAALVPVANPIGRRDYERLMDDAVKTQIEQRFGVLCSRMSRPDAEAQAFEDFKDAVHIIFRARAMAEAFLFKELNTPGDPLDKP